MEKQKLYVKNDKGRYEEYREPDPPRNNALYRKCKFGNKVVYERTGMHIGTDCLDEGVWVIVKNTYGKSYASGKYLNDMFMCLKASDIQDVSLAKLGGMEKLADYLCSHWNELPKQASQYDLCRAIVGLLFKYEEKKKNGEK